jgi:3-phenylpropionate/cinnamic acid dioxygenase small subunit
LELFDEDGIYWLPIDITTNNPLESLNLIYDDRARLDDRVARLGSGFAFSETPPCRTSHLISNSRFVEPIEYREAVHCQGLDGATVALSGRLVVGVQRAGMSDVFHGRAVWALRECGDSFLIRMKRVDLLNAAEPLPVLTFLI